MNAEAAKDAKKDRSSLRPSRPLRSNVASVTGRRLHVFIEQANRTEDEKWKSAYALFERAMELPAAERSAFTERCSEDPDVLRLVLELLDAEPPDRATPQYTGKEYGRFAVGELLGQGGMGEVYSARDK